MTKSNNNGWTKDLNTIKYPFFVFFKKTIIARDDNEPYLIRRTLLSIGKWFSIKLHKILRSDDACIHDHPWSFITFIYKGGYYEWTTFERASTNYPWADHKSAPDGQLLVKIWYPPGTLLYRPAKWAHALELKRNDKDEEIPCSTFVLTFKVTRKWGFFTPRGWVYWRNYTQKEHC